MSELPAEVPTVAGEGDTTINPNIPITSTTTTITETRGPRTFLPNGSPSRPTATATCRLQMWVQNVLEGQINDPPQKALAQQKEVYLNFTY